MRLTEFAAKRIVNLYDGGIIGTAGESDLLIDPENGLIDAIVLPQTRGGLGGIGTSPKRQISIPWETVKKVGAEVIVIELEETR